MQSGSGDVPSRGRAATRPGHKGKTDRDTVEIVTERITVGETDPLAKLRKAHGGGR